MFYKVEIIELNISKKTQALLLLTILRVVSLASFGGGKCCILTNGNIGVYFCDGCGGNQTLSLNSASVFAG